MSCLFGRKRFCVVDVVVADVEHGIDDCLSNNPLVRGGGGEQGELGSIKTTFVLTGIKKLDQFLITELFLIYQNCLAF